MQTVKNILFFLGIALLLSCKENITELQPAYHKTHFPSSFDLRELAPKIRFEFVAAKAKEFKGLIKIEGTLFNDGKDTAYFLSSTCDGMQYNLNYDTTKWNLFPTILCDVSNPLKEMIAPKGKIDFNAYFKPKVKCTEIGLQFYYYLIPPKFDMHRLERERNYTFEKYIFQQNLKNSYEILHCNHYFFSSCPFLQPIC